MTTSSTRFWAKVARKSQDDCWPWKGGTWSGYGRVKIAGKVYSAHRVAFVLSGLVDPSNIASFGRGYHGAVVRHTCDNRLCCNPKHLLIGTQKDNVNDAIERGNHYFPNGGGR